MALRRGFKSEANALAREFRHELGLAEHSPLCPRRLAEHLGLEICCLGDLEQVEPAAVAYLRSETGRKEFSAVTICYGNSRLIIHNEALSPKRQTSDLIHEISHVVLHHPPKPPFDGGGNRHYERRLEEEANWLGPALLVSEEAALHIAEEGYSVPVASNLYRVTEAIIRMRLSVSGAARRIARRLAAE